MCGGSQVGQVLEQLEENVLSHVFGRLPVAKKSPREAEHHVLVTPNETPERRRVARNRLCESLILVVID